jgi:hypothetical protein
MKTLQISLDQKINNMKIKSLRLAFMQKKAVKVKWKSLYSTFQKRKVILPKHSLMNLDLWNVLKLPGQGLEELPLWILKLEKR